VLRSPTSLKRPWIGIRASRWRSSRQDSWRETWRSMRRSLGSSEKRMSLGRIQTCGALAALRDRGGTDIELV
jgi:hypothetical protein